MVFNFKCNHVLQDGNASVQHFKIDGHYFNLSYQNDSYPLSPYQHHSKKDFLKGIHNQKFNGTLNATIFSNGLLESRTGLKVSLSPNAINSSLYFNSNINDISLASALMLLSRLGIQHFWKTYPDFLNQDNQDIDITVEQFQIVLPISECNNKSNSVINRLQNYQHTVIMNDLPKSNIIHIRLNHVVAVPNGTAIHATLVQPNALKDCHNYNVSENWHPDIVFKKPTLEINIEKYFTDFNLFNGNRLDYNASSTWLYNEPFPEITNSSRIIAPSEVNRSLFFTRFDDRLKNLIHHNSFETIIITGSQANILEKYHIIDLLRLATKGDKIFPVILLPSTSKMTIDGLNLNNKF